MPILLFNFIFRAYSTDPGNSLDSSNNPTSNLKYDDDETKTVSVFSSMFVVFVSVMSYLYNTSFHKMITDTLNSVKSFYLSIFYGIYFRILRIGFWLVSLVDDVIDYFFPCLFNSMSSSNVPSCSNSTSNTPKLTHAALAAITAPPCNLLLSPSQMSQYSTHSLMTINSADLSFVDDMDESITPALLEDRMRYKKFGSSRESSFCNLIKYLRSFIIPSKISKKK